MASIYKRRDSRPVPEGAEFITYRGRAYARWTDAAGKAQRAPLSPSGDKIVLESRNYTIKYFDHTGRRVKVATKCPDKDAAQQLANDLERQAMLRRKGIINTTAERMAQESARPVEQHADEYEAALRSRGRNARYVTESCERLRRVLRSCGASTIRDITTGTVQRFVQALRDDGRGLETVNAYLRSVKSFTRWLWREKRTPDDILAGLPQFNAQADRRHVRRELTPEEQAVLLSFVESDETPFYNLSGQDRAALYRLALGTGFRAGELRSLTPASFDLDADPPTVTVDAGHSKRRRQDVQPIRRDLAELLRPWLAGRPHDERLFQRLPKHTSRMMQHDMQAARAQWTTAVPDGPERERREQSDFLQYRDAAGRVADFHSLRHTFVSGIVASGASVKVAQELARHSTPVLTIGRYAHTRLHDLTAALDGLPSPGTDDHRQALQATGTHGQTADADWAFWDQKRDQLNGKTGRNAAKRGEQQDAEGREKAPHDAGPQVLSMSSLGSGRQDAAKRDQQAEGTRFELATPCGAPHLQCGEIPAETSIVATNGTNNGTSENDIPQDLQAIIDAWPDLPEPLRAGILAMVQGVKR